MQIEITYELNSKSARGRLAELSQKTNQFNTGLQRFSEVEVARRLEEPGQFAISIAMRDRFCDSGIIGAIFARAEGDRLVIDEVAISCRALGRSIESPMIAMALAPMIELYGLREVAFRFREGPRNLPARLWLANFTLAAKYYGWKLSRRWHREALSASRRTLTERRSRAHWEEMRRDEPSRDSGGSRRPIKY